MSPATTSSVENAFQPPLEKVKLVLDEDGIWRDRRDVRVDDDGNIIWVGGGLRKDVI